MNKPIELDTIIPYQTLYCPPNAHIVKNVELLKHFKIKEAAPTCFSLQVNHHQGATASA
jgi:hypothetical protein